MKGACNATRFDTHTPAKSHVGYAVTTKLTLYTPQDLAQCRFNQKRKENQGTRPSEANNRKCIL